MAQTETFEATYNGVTTNIDIPNPNGLSREQLGPDVGRAIQSIIKSQGHLGEPTPPPAPEEDRSLGSAAQYGAAHAVTGLGKTGALIADKAAGSGIAPLETAGKWWKQNAPNIQGSIPEPKNYKPGGEDLAQNIRDGNYSAMPGNILRAGVESVAPGAAVIAGTMAGGIPGGLATSAGLSLGDNVEAAGGDVLKGAGASAVQAPLDVFGVKGFGKALAKVPTAVGRAAAYSAREGAGQGLGEAAKEGIIHGEIDPANVGAAALAGAASRGVMEMPGLAKSGLAEVGGGIRAGAENLMSRYGIDQPKTEAEARVYQMAADHINAAKELDRANGKESSDTQIANSAHTTLKAQLYEAVVSLSESGGLDRGEARLIKAGLKNAERHNSVLLGEADPVMDIIQNAAGLDPNTKSSLSALLQGVDALSGTSLQKRTVGPGERLGQTIGSLGSIAGGIAHGSPHTIIAGLGGHTIAGKVVGLGGRMIDKALGLSKPEVMYQGMAADRLYGQHDGPGLSDHIDNINGGLSDPASALFDQIRSDRRGKGRTETFNPDDSATASPDQPGLWAHTLGNAERENAAMTAADTAAKKATTKAAADAEAKTAADQKLADAKARTEEKAANALLPRPPTPYEQRSLDIADGKAIDRQRTRDRNDAATSATADLVGQEKSAREVARSDAAKKTTLAKAQALEATAQAKREGDTTKAEKAKATQDALTKAQQENSAWAAHGDPVRPLTGNERRTQDIGDAHALDKAHEPAPTPDELGNLPDPVPVNTPIKAKGRGLAAAQAILAEKQTIPKLVPNGPDALDIREQMADAKPAPSEASPALQKAQGHTPTGDVPQGNQASPQTRPDTYGKAADDHTIPTGSDAYAAIALNGRDTGLISGPRVTVLERREAVGHLLENGTLGRMLEDPKMAPELADAIIHNHVPASHPMSKAVAHAIILQVAQNRGVLHEIAHPRAPGDPITPVTQKMREDSGAAPRLDAEGKPIRSIDAYNNAGKAYHSQVAAQIKTAQEKGYPRLATALDQISAVSGLMDKLAIRTPYINALREAAKRGTQGAKAELTHALTALDFKGMAMKGKMPKGPQ